MIAVVCWQSSCLKARMLLIQVTPQRLEYVIQAKNPCSVVQHVGILNFECGSLFPSCFQHFQFRISSQIISTVAFWYAANIMVMFSSQQSPICANCYTFSMLSGNRKWSPGEMCRWLQWHVVNKAVSSIAGHFLGNNTVIDVLRQAGYEVEHTPAGQPFEQ